MKRPLALKQQIEALKQTGELGEMNPPYIIVASILKPGKDGRNCKVLQLAAGHERSEVPIYHAARRGRAMGPYTSLEAASVVAGLKVRDANSSAILRARYGQSVEVGIMQLLTADGTPKVLAVSDIAIGGTGITDGLANLLDGGFVARTPGGYIATEFGRKHGPHTK